MKCALIVKGLDNYPLLYWRVFCENVLIMFKTKTLRKMKQSVLVYLIEFLAVINSFYIIQNEPDFFIYFKCQEFTDLT